MTPREKQLLDSITSFIARYGYSPTFEQMALSLGLSAKSGVARLLDSLERQGAIRRRPDARRCVEIVERRGGADHLLARLQAEGFILDEDGEGEMVVCDLADFRRILREVLG